MSRPFCVGLTGGVGSGKSLVADQFAALGVEVVDTDVIARTLTQAGGVAMPAIEVAFGEGVIAPDGSLDRRRMRELIFADSVKRKRLEAILHPLIRQAVAKCLAESHAPYVIVVVPLLVETGAYENLVDRVLLVDCPAELQIARVMRRDGVSETMVESMMAAQSGRARRLERANDVIDNSYTEQEVAGQVAGLHRLYSDIADRK
jgi:dephospho-CoA kinase